MPVDELKEFDATLDRLASESAKRLRDQIWHRSQTAAIFMAAAVDNPERLRSEAALARYAAPVPLQCHY